MSRHFNIQYQQFKAALQRKFNERYNTDTTVQYTEQDLAHVAMATNPIVPKPYRPEIPNRYRRHAKSQSVAKSELDDFEREYEEFIAKLKTEKAAKEIIEQQTENIVDDQENKQ